MVLLAKSTSIGRMLGLAVNVALIAGCGGKLDPERIEDWDTGGELAAQTAAIEAAKPALSPAYFDGMRDRMQLPGFRMEDYKTDTNAPGTWPPVSARFKLVANEVTPGMKAPLEFLVQTTPCMMDLCFNYGSPDDWERHKRLFQQDDESVLRADVFRAKLGGTTLKGDVTFTRNTEGDAPAQLRAPSGSVTWNAANLSVTVSFQDWDDWGAEEAALKAFPVDAVRNTLREILRAWLAARANPA